MAGLTFSMMFFGILLAALSTESRTLRMILMALAGAVAVLAGVFWYCAAAKATFSAFMGDWGTLVIGAAAAAAALGAIAGFMQRGATFKRSFAGGIFTSPTAILTGETPEAMIPLQSPKAARMGLTGPGGGGVTIMNATFNVKADKPSTLYKEMQVAVGRRSYETRR